MIGQRFNIWREGEYDYSAAYGFVPFMVSYIHEDDEIRPGMLVVPGGAYRYASPSEGHMVAEEFYREGYNVFVLAYTVNYLDTPLKMQPLKDISRAVRIIRKHAVRCHIDPDRIAVCGFSAGGHLCGSLCVHWGDVSDPAGDYAEVSNRPDAALLCYPVINSGKYANRASFLALLGEDPDEEELNYMSLEYHVTKETPPCFLWQTAPDASVPVENSYLFAEACREAGVPYAHHVFSEGVHGMSAATERWLERDFGDTYTLDQIRMLCSAIREEKAPYPEEKAQEIAEEFGFDGKKREKWTPEETERIRKTLPEVGIWPKLAVSWLNRQWEVLSSQKREAGSEV